MIQHLFLFFFVLISFFSIGQGDTTRYGLQKRFDSKNVLIYEGTFKGENYFTGKVFKYDEAGRPAGYTIWKEGVPEDSLRNKIQSLYLQILSDYFQDTIGDKDMIRYGFNFVVAAPHTLPYEFSVNGKPFKFDDPPYHNQFVGIGKVAKENKGRKAYFLDMNYHLNRGASLPDTLEIVFSYYLFTGEEGRKGTSSQWGKQKQGLMKYSFVAGNGRNHWVQAGVKKL